MSATSGEYCLVRFGAAGFLGYFRLAEPHTEAERGDKVVIHSARGVELGEVLRRDPIDLGSAMGPSAGEPGAVSEAMNTGTVLRRATSADQVRAEVLASQCRELLACAENFCHGQDLPIVVVDAEAIWEPASFVLHLLRVGQGDERPLVAALSQQFKAPIRVHDLTAPASAEAAGAAHGSCGSGGCGLDGCGSEGCGSGGCQTGCGSGCGTHTPVEFDQQWREYFAVLREHMERRRPLPIAG